MHRSVCQHTCRGRVVYNRPKHTFSLKDLARVQKAVASSVEVSDDPDTIQIIVTIIDNFSEMILESMLAPIGASFLADEIVDALKSLVDKALSGIEKLGEAYYPEEPPTFVIPY